MVIDQINVGCVLALESEYDAPVARNRNREMPASVPMQGMKAKPRRIHRRRFPRRVQLRQNKLNPPCVLGGNTTRVVGRKQALKSFMAKTQNHLRV
jgi:hypothetical protein